jgi:hypothetical protein
LQPTPSSAFGSLFLKEEDLGKVLRLSFDERKIKGRRFGSISLKEEDLR